MKLITPVLALLGFTSAQLLTDNQPNGLATAPESCDSKQSSVPFHALLSYIVNY